MFGAAKMDQQNLKKRSLFDDIYRLQNTAPDHDVDPEDPEDGFQARLVENVDTGENVTASKLRRQVAIIPEDPKYKGKKTSRRSLYSDDESDQSSDLRDYDESEGVESDISEGEEDDDPDVSASDEDDHDDNDMDHDDITKEETAVETVQIPSTKSDDREKGKAVMYQLGVWDDLIKSRIALQKLVTASNQLPQPDTWPLFAENNAFRTEAKNVHSSVRKLISALLELQLQLSVTSDKNGGKKKSSNNQSDEEITSESEGEEGEEKDHGESRDTKGEESEEDEDEEADEDEDDNEEEGSDEAMDTSSSTPVNKKPKRIKRKLSVSDVEETLSKRQKEFQTVRNDILSKWDEKTRLVQGRVKAKNFAAFETSVLKQIEQVLVNKERLVRRLHQQRSDYRILGQPQDGSNEGQRDEDVVDDDDDDVELKLKQRSKYEPVVNPEIIDDNDFYHVCLRDLIEMKQNEETDPVIANRQWLEIQRLRNKQKKKVDTRASKGRKIRYNVKEKLKNYMTPYDKSQWSEEQKDDLFKALFGGQGTQSDMRNGEREGELPFKLGI